jgi:hypothetical protein
MTQQEKFCEIIKYYKDQYSAVGSKDHYIDQERDLQAVLDERTELLKTVLGNGAVSRWNVSVESISADSDDRTVRVKFGTCGVILEPEHGTRISSGTTLYESLRRVHEKSNVELSGTFIQDDGSHQGQFTYRGHFAESSFTRAGSMRDPEYLFVTEKIN